MLDSKIQSDLERLILEHEGNRVPNLPHDSRGRLVKYVERLLVNPRLLDAHCQFLKDRFQRGFKYRDPPTEEQTDKVLQHSHSCS